MTIDRRSLFLSTGALALGNAACGPDADAWLDGTAGDEQAFDESELTATFEIDTTRFPLGVMAGDPLPNKVMLWTKYVGDQLPTLRVYETDKEGNTGTRIHSAPIEKSQLSDAGFVHVDFGGLKPNTTYRYRFIVDPGAQNKQFKSSGMGRFTTALAPGSRASLTFAGIACTNPVTGERDDFKVLADAATRKDLDFMLHLGDHVYADSAKTRTEYRQVYTRQWQRRGMKNLHKSTGMIEVWDDHEVDNNWELDTIGDARLAAARGAAFEHRPLRRNPTDPNRWWRTFEFGETAQLWLIDVRSERKQGSRMISNAQLEWLKAGLKASKAVFKFIALPQPITNWPGESRGAWGHAWEQRTDLCDFILSLGKYASTGLTAAERRGLFFLGGDVHMGVVGRISPTGSDYFPLRELIVGPGGAKNPNDKVRALKKNNVGQGEQFSMVTGRNNYTVISVNPDATGGGGKLTVKYVGVLGDSDRDTFYEKTYDI